MTVIKSRASILLFTALSVATVSAQSTYGPMLSHVVPAQVVDDDGKPRLSLTIDAYRTEKRVVPTKTFVQEPREIKVVENGRSVTRTINVRAPKVQRTEVEVRVLAGQVAAHCDPQDFRFYDLNGAEVTFDAVSDVLQKPTPVFLLERYRGEPPPFTRTQQRGIQSECIIAVTKKTIRDRMSAVHSDTMPNLTHVTMAKVDSIKDTPGLILLVHSYRTNIGPSSDEAANKERNRRRVPTRVAAGLKPVTLEAETVSFYRLDGTPVAFKQAAAELSSLHPVFFLDRTSKPPSSLSDIQQQAFPDDMLIVVTEQAVRERYRRGYVYR